MKDPEYAANDRAKAKRRNTPDSQHEKRLRNYPRYLWRVARSRALRKGLEFTITPDDIVIPSVCPVLGIRIEMQRYASIRANHTSASIDRIDNSRGYASGNIVMISNRANVLKSNATIDELVKIAAFYQRLRMISSDSWSTQVAQEEQ